jgi:hypothetical protein
MQISPITNWSDYQKAWKAQVAEFADYPLHGSLSQIHAFFLKHPPMGFWGGDSTGAIEEPPATQLELF